jgi:hypothetical protein
METVAAKKSKGHWFIMLFGLPFLGVGAFLLFLGWKMWFLWFQSSMWLQVPAMVTNA